MKKRDGQGSSALGGVAFGCVLSLAAHAPALMILIVAPLAAMFSFVLMLGVDWVFEHKLERGALREIIVTAGMTLVVATCPAIVIAIGQRDFLSMVGVAVIGWAAWSGLVRCLGPRPDPRPNP